MSRQRQSCDRPRPASTNTSPCSGSTRPAKGADSMTSIRPHSSQVRRATLPTHTNARAVQSRIRWEGGAMSEYTRFEGFDGSAETIAVAAPGRSGRGRAAASHSSAVGSGIGGRRVRERAHPPEGGDASLPLLPEPDLHLSAHPALHFSVAAQSPHHDAATSGTVGSQGVQDTEVSRRAAPAELPLGAPRQAAERHGAPASGDHAAMGRACHTKLNAQARPSYGFRSRDRCRRAMRPGFLSETAIPQLLTQSRAPSSRQCAAQG